MPQYELNLRDYWQIIQKRWLVLVFTIFTVLTISVISTNMQKPLYQAIASVEWSERRTTAGLLLEFVEYSYRTDPLATQSRIITSLPVLERVVKELGLVDEHANAAEITQQAANIQGAVSTAVVPDTNIIHIIVTHEDPQVAAKIANKVAQVYIAENLREKSKQSRSVREFIERQLEKVSARLKTSEEVLANFKETEVPSGVALPLQDKLMNLEMEHQNLLRKYTAIHPAVKNIEEQITQMKGQLKALPQKELEYSRLNREVEINVRSYHNLKEKLEGARITEAEKTEDVNLVEPATIPGAPISPKKLLNYFLGTVIGLMLGLSGTFLVEQLDTSIGTIEDVETYLKLPVLGVIPYLKIQEEREAFLRRLWPKQYKGKDKILRLRDQLLLNFSSSSPVFEAYRILRTNIQREISKDNIQRKILLFSSSGPEEGKSITIVNLAIAMAQGGLRILLIDGDLRRSVIHNIFGIENKVGLSDILIGTTEPQDAIKTFTDILISKIDFNKVLKTHGLDNLNILLSGPLISTSAELLGSQELVKLLENLREKYDFIIIDSPPILAVADTIILGHKTDGVILVYRVGKTARSVLSRAKTQLVKAGAQVIGVVLNNMSPQMEMRYGYYYYYKYYGKYYTSGQEKTKDIKG